MCGRYVLSLRPSQVRQHLVDTNMPVDEAPDDDDDRNRQSYNFAPGYHGLIYRAQSSGREDGSKDVEYDEPAVDGLATLEIKYKLQAAKWGLVPFWTKRPPDHASQMRTINCRDDSLIEDRGMWNTMKKRKRAVIIAEGFYEWLKKDNGKVKIPHYMKRKDGRLMLFAGLWDMVQYEGSEEKLYTYTIITTDSNKQLKFLHDRMPVILEPGSEAMKMWLDPKNMGWSKQLQSMLKPFQGELECYPVDKAVGKVGNNSPSFVVPVDSKENKKNIANFFDTQRATSKSIVKNNGSACQTGVESTGEASIQQHPEEHRETTQRVETTEDNAPLPDPKGQSGDKLSQQIKKDGAEIGDQELIRAADEQVDRGIKREMAHMDDEDLLKAVRSPPNKTIKTEKATPSPVKSSPDKPGSQKKRSATSNNKVAKTPVRGNAKITSFFGS